MIARGRGSIVALTGSNVLSGAVGKVHSSAAKAGLTGMIRALARELAPQGIRANCVSPGIIDTSRPSHRSPRRDPQGLVPLNRWGEPQEIAATVRFLCGPGRQATSPDRRCTSTADRRWPERNAAGGPRWVRSTHHLRPPVH